MSKIGLRGLQGLKGLNRADEIDRQQFFAKNKGLFDQFSGNFALQRELMDAAYNDHKFRKAFNLDQAAFDDVSNRYNYDQRVALYNSWDTARRNRAILQGAEENYKPFNGKKFDPNKGFGSIDLWNQYSEMSPEGWKRLMESDWKTPAEMRQLRDDARKKMSAVERQNAYLYVPGGSNYIASEAGLEAYLQKETEDNNKIIDQIYNDDLVSKTQKLENEVSNAYSQNTGSDSAVRKRWREIFANDDSPMVQMHKGQYAAHIGSKEMKNYSIDDMRKDIAKWDTYTKYMSPYAAGTAINNDAQRYIADHQKGWEKAKAYLGDFAISTMSYLADKVNGFVNLGYGLADMDDGGVETYIDKDTNDIVDANIVKQDPRDGHLFYYDDKGKSHGVRKRVVARTTLRNMGKNLDGSENHGLLWDGDLVTLNPQYWSRAEQYGTLSEDKQKQYEQLGASPHTVAYNPNEEGNFWWEVFKMGTFGLADMITSLIPIGNGVSLAGKGVSTLSKVGKTSHLLNRGINRVGKFLINNNQKIAQTAQGNAGALGIAYAYNRGAFSETLEKNLSRADEAVQERANNDFAERYNTDENYKRHIDNRIASKAEELKKSYLANMDNAPAELQTANAASVNQYINRQAADAVQQEETGKIANDLKKTPEYTQMQDAAVDEAGDAAFNTFWPEAVKYGLVNTVGFRKWLYTNPTGLKAKVSPALKGLKEITTKEGRQRLAQIPKFLTRKDKMGQFAKTVGSQMWGGAWTNGTDDMMTDAAEMMSDDSYSRYVNGFLDGEAIADTYGMSDGMYTFMKNMNSYIKGLSNSVGQETTWNATKVGAFGSVLSGNLNFVNAARLLTKKGRESYRKNFQERYKRDENGIIPKDEKGNPITEKVSWRENWRDRMAYFIQNGILSPYYGKKQEEKELQSHADFLNNLLDDVNDFEDITGLIASDNGLEDAVGTSDKKTMRFIKALRTAKTLANLGNSSSDPAKMSSVVQNAKALMDAASQISFDTEKDNVPQDELPQQLIKNYYAVNDNAANPHNDSTDRRALATVIKNSRDFQEAAEAYDNAEKEIQKIETAKGENLTPEVRERLKLNHALNGHWQRRLDTMKNEIGDTSQPGTLSEEDIIPSLGGKKNAEDLVKVYDRQEKEIAELMDSQQKRVDEAQQKYDEAVKTLSDNTNDDLNYELQKKVLDAKAELDNTVLNKGYFQEMLASTRSKKERVAKALEATKEEGYKDRVLTADEIMNLDPVTRARMLYDPQEAVAGKEGTAAGKEASKEKSRREKMYSPEQIAEIEKLEKQLTMKDADALQKIQDISLLTQRIETNKDSYNKILKNPEAAAKAFEAQRDAAAEKGYGIIDQRTAETVANLINDAGSTTEGFKDLSQEEKETAVFNALKELHPRLLYIIDNDNLLPQYQKQIKDAKDWQKAITDLDAVIYSSDKDDRWVENVIKYIDAAEKVSRTREELLSTLEKAVDNEFNDASVREALDYVLNGMESLGYHRDATVLENRAKRKEREAKEKAEAAEREAKEKALKEKLAKAAEAEEAARKAEATKKGAEDEAEVTEDIDEGEDAEDAEKVGEGEGLDLELNEKSEEAESNGDIDKNIIDNGDTIGSRNETLEEQIKEAEEDGNKQYSSDENVDSERVNDNTEAIMDNTETTLTGNSMSEYLIIDLDNPDGPSIKNGGVLVHKKGKKDRDPMNRYYAWMKNAGVHLQNIIDTELHRILDSNPHTKIKFMYVNPSGKGTDDAAMQNHLLLVVDYDDNINKGISSIHNEENGGVITSNGKQYLIVGVAGYGKNNKAKRDLYDILMSNNPKSPYGYGVIRTESKKYFDTHPDERYYVNEDISTEVVPRSLIPGYIVRQLESDSNAEYRDISEVLKDKERNPEGLTLKDLGWGIQEYSQFLTVFPGGAKEKRVLVPRNMDANIGRVFVLIPAANGALIPSYIKPLFYADAEGNGSVMREGKLKDEVYENLNKLAARDNATRVEGIIGLSKIFLFDNEKGDGILTTKDKEGKAPVVSFLHNGSVFRSFNLDDQSFNRQQLFDAFATMNPRVNITYQVLSNIERLEIYDEAGALQTDAALLHTVGSSYSIYAIDANGNMIEEAKAPENAIQTTPSDDDFRKDSRQVVFKHSLYIYKDGKYYLNGKEVTDEKELRQLEYNRRIFVENRLVPSVSEGIWDTFVLSKGEHPEVVKVNKNTYEVKEVPEAEAKALIEKLDKKNGDKKREDAAEDALKVGEGEDVNLEDTGDEDNNASKLEGQKEDKTEQKEQQPTQEEQDFDPETGEVYDELHPKPNRQTPAPTPPSGDRKGTQTFAELRNNPKYKRRITMALMTKWKDAPKDMDILMDYLRKQNVEVDAIGTSDADIEAWIKTNIECR